MRVAIAGAGGQLGRMLLRSAPPGVQLTAWTRADLDIGDAAAVSARCAASRPDVVINAAAYTAVDRAESEPGQAFRVNADGVEHLARSVRDCGGRLLHVSTDFVFDGQASTPYGLRAEPRPLGVYGSSKLEGERRALAVLADRALVLRTSWVYSAGSSRNFVHSILRAGAAGGPLRVVCDQIGAPTWAGSLAAALWQAAARPLGGVHHWSDAGVASRYDFAVAIVEEAAGRELVPSTVRVNPVYSEDFPAVARRPSYSVLDLRETSAALQMTPVHWRSKLREMMDEVEHV